MQTHIKVLGWLHIVLNAVALAAGVLIWLVLTATGAIAAASGEGRDALPIFAVFGGIGTFVLVLVAVFVLPGILVGWGLLREAPWARPLGIVASILDLFNPPLWTALGIYGLIVLFNAETAAIFEGRRPPVY